MVVGGLGTAALGLGLAGAILAVVATFAAVIEIRSVTVTLDTLTGWDRHGPALLLLGVFGLLMVAGGARGARPAMAALAVAGIAILLIALLIDQPHLHDAGTYGDTFEAEAKAGKGWLFETAAGVLMLAGGVLALLLPRRERLPARASRRPRAAPPAPIAPSTPPARTDADWFADPPVETRAQRLTQPQPPPRRRRLRGRDR